MQVARTLPKTGRSIEHDGVIVVTGRLSAWLIIQRGIDPCCGVRLGGFVILGRERDSATDHGARNHQRKDELFHGAAPDLAG